MRVRHVMSLEMSWAIIEVYRWQSTYALAISRKMPRGMGRARQPTGFGFQSQGSVGVNLAVVGG